MNKDQALSITRTLLKVIGSALVTHGATKAAGLLNSEDVIGLILTVVGLVWSHFQHSDDSSNPNPIIGPSGKLPLWLLTIGLSVIALGTGCSHFKSTVSETVIGGVTNRITTVGATTFFDAKSQLSKLATGQTDKGNQKVSVGALNEEASGSNAVQVLRIVVESAATGAAKAIVP